MFRLPRKIFLKLFLFLFLISFFLFVSKTQALAKPADSFNDLNINKAIDIEQNLQQQEKDDQTRIEIGRTNRISSLYTIVNFTCFIAPCKGISTMETSALGGLAMLMGKTYQFPPASGIAWTRDVLANANLIKPAYAQGIGFAGLTPYLSFWKTTRNIAYIVLIIVMVTIGFMVIFRMKIDPKTVISVQAALPRIVMTLILITLSYPIIGFMIDIMYLSMAIIVSIIVNGAQGSIWGKDIAAWQTELMTADLGDLGGLAFTGSFTGLWNAAISKGASFADITAMIASFIGFGIFTGPIGAFTMVNAVAGGLLILPAILGLILVLGALFTFIRLFLLLLNSYIQLLISLILSPLLLLQEAIPGKSAFSEWILNIIANLVVFPATAAIFLFVSFLTFTAQSTTNEWMPPFIGIGGGGTGMFRGILAMGIVFLSPNLVAQVKKMFHPKPIIPLTAGTAFAPLTGATQTAMGAASQFYYLKMTFPKLFGGEHK